MYVSGNKKELIQLLGQDFPRTATGLNKFLNIVCIFMYICVSQTLALQRSRPVSTKYMVIIMYSGTIGNVL